MNASKFSIKQGIAPKEAELRILQGMLESIDNPRSSLTKSAEEYFKSKDKTSKLGREICSEFFNSDDKDRLKKTLKKDIGELRDLKLNSIELRKKLTSNISITPSSRVRLLGPQRSLAYSILQQAVRSEIDKIPSEIRSLVENKLPKIDEAEISTKLLRGDKYILIKCRAAAYKIRLDSFLKDYS